MTSLASATNSVETAGTEVTSFGYEVSGRTTPQGLPAPRLCRESGGVTPTAQMTRVIGSRRAEVQGCAPVIEGGGRLPIDSRYPTRMQRNPGGRWPTGLTGTASASAVLPAVYLVPADPAAVEGTRCVRATGIYSAGLGHWLIGALPRRSKRVRFLQPAPASAPRAGSSLPLWRVWPPGDFGLSRRRSFSHESVVMREQIGRAVASWFSRLCGSRFRKMLRVV